jgi:endonuclease/exonuclease/phosphatase family metal-dependent hydrolase
MIVVWAKADPGYRYVEGVIRGVEIYRDLFLQGPTVLIGDLTSNVIWDSHHRNGLNHSGLVKLLASLGLASAYHRFNREEPGHETQPTFYLHKNPLKPYHIDYCFIPENWIKRLSSVKVGSNEDWSVPSDHRPLIVDIE